MIAVHADLSISARCRLLSISRSSFYYAPQPESDETLALVQARALLIDSLAKQGLERIDALNVGFDPQIHDAVVHVAGDGDDEQVIDEVLRAGYRWKGAVMRPAMVRVKG